MLEINVGDMVMYRSSGGRDNRMHKVVRKGTKYVYINRKGYREDAFSLEDGKAKDGIGWIKTMAQVAEEDTRREHLEMLKDRGVILEWQCERRLSTSQLHALASVAMGFPPVES